MKQFLEVSDLTPDALHALVADAIARKRERSHELAGKIVGLVFEKPSLRTRVSSSRPPFNSAGRHCTSLAAKSASAGVKASPTSAARLPITSMRSFCVCSSTAR